MLQSRTHRQDKCVLQGKRTLGTLDEGKTAKSAGLCLVSQPSSNRNSQGHRTICHHWPLNTNSSRGELMIVNSYIDVMHSVQSNTLFYDMMYDKIPEMIWYSIS